MACRHVDGLATLQLWALCQSLLQAGCAVTTLQPVAQQRALPGITGPKQIGQAGQIGRLVRGAGRWWAEEGEFCRWRVVAESAHHVEPGYFECAQALAQCCLDCVFPTLLHVDAAPQCRQLVQPVFAQPGPQLAIGLDPVLQRLECFQAGRQRRLPGRVGVNGLLHHAARVVKGRQRILHFVHPGISDGCRFADLCQLQLQALQQGFVGGVQSALVGTQAFAPGVKLTRQLLHTALFCCQHLDLLLHLRYSAALLVGSVLCQAQRLFELGQLLRMFLHLRRQHHTIFLGTRVALHQFNDFSLRVGPAGGPLRALFLQGRQPLLDTLAPLDDKTYLGLQPSYLGAGFIQQTLRLVDLVTGTVVGLAHRFEVGLSMAQVGDPALHRVARGLAVHCDSGLFGLGVGQPEVPQLVLPEGHIRLQSLVLLCHLGLLLQLVQVGTEFAQNVLHPRQVLPCIAQAVFGFTATFLVFGYSRSLFKKEPQLFGFGLDDAADGALPDDGVGTWPQAGAQKDVLHVAPTHGLVVDVVAAGAITRQHPFHRNFGKLAPLPAGPVVGVLEHQLHTGTARRFAAGGAVENDVLHRLATQLAGAAFPQYPAHRVHDVRLATAVRADHTHQLAWQHEVGGLGERLEAR